MVFFQDSMPLSLSFLFWQNGHKMTALSAYEQYVHQSQLCIIKPQSMEGPWSKNSTMRTNKPFVYYLRRLMIKAYIKEDKILSEYSNNRYRLISKPRVILVQLGKHQFAWASASSLTDSFCFYIVSK